MTSCCAIRVSSFRHSRLSRRKRRMETLAADHAAGIPRHRTREKALLGAQHGRLAGRRRRRAERRASRAGATRRRAARRDAGDAERRRSASARGQHGRHRTARQHRRRDVSRLRHAAHTRVDPAHARSRESRTARSERRTRRRRRRASRMARPRNVPDSGVPELRRPAETVGRVLRRERAARARRDRRPRARSGGRGAGGRR